MPIDSFCLLALYSESRFTIGTRVLFGTWGLVKNPHKGPNLKTSQLQNILTRMSGAMTTEHRNPVPKDRSVLRLLFDTTARPEASDVLLVLVPGVANPPNEPTSARTPPLTRSLTHRPS
jgi:hypothetical protein